VGETLAVKYLTRKGYVIVEQNFLTPEGEIDIICHDPQGVLTFIEVKARKNFSFGTGLEGVTDLKEERMEKAINAYMDIHDLNGDSLWQAEVIAIDLSQNPPVIDHIENAFM
jgi:putative endonuclease